MNSVRANTVFSTFAPALEDGPVRTISFSFSSSFSFPISPSRPTQNSQLTSPNQHAGVHGGINGEMAIAIGSTNDPIFFLHHAQVDRVWWLWQQQNPSARNYDYSGMEWANQPATLDSIMYMSDFAPERKVRDFMTTNNADLCYKY
jgi:hypothetical protein